MVNAELISTTDRLKAIAVLENLWLHGQWMANAAGFIPTFYDAAGVSWTRRREASPNIVDIVDIVVTDNEVCGSRNGFRLSLPLHEFVEKFNKELIDPVNRRQQLFDRIAMHLMQQAERATDNSGVCVYSMVRKGNVLKCAVGCLFPEGLAEQKGINSQGVPTYQRITNLDPMKNGHRNMQGFREAFDQAGVDWRDPGAIELLARLQTVHDGARTVSAQEVRNFWLPELQGVASQMGLNDLTLRRLAVKYCCELL